MDLIYSIAKSIVEKRQAKKEKLAKIQAEINVNYQARQAFVKKVFIKKFVEEAIEEFKRTSVPKYSVDQKVLTNWYSGRDTWEGYVSSLQMHTPFQGPIVVKITDINVDALFLEECLDNFHTNGKFDDVLLIEDHYFDFCAIAKKELRDRETKILGMTDRPTIPYITWSYKIKVPKDEKEYWGYCWSERKLLKLDSEVAFLTQKAWKKDQKVEKNRKKVAETKDELDAILKELNTFAFSC